MGFTEEYKRQLENTRTPVYMKDKVEIALYYQEQYGRKWTRKLAEDLIEKGGETGKIKSIQRRLQGARINSTPEGTFQEALEKLGRELPPSFWEPPSGGYMVKFSGQIKISNKWYKRGFQKIIDEDTAYNMVNSPEDISIFTDWYFEHDDISEGISDDSSIELIPLY